jgi:hypothetical protein
MELADALLESTNITYLRLVTKSIRKALQRQWQIRAVQLATYTGSMVDGDDEGYGSSKNVLLFLPAFQEARSRELAMELHCRMGRPTGRSIC